MSATVSIIIPVYNCSMYIDRCMKSVIDQTYHDWEVIAVDDGSQDDSLQCLRKWEEYDSRIHVLAKPNSGVVETREYGLRHAAGDYLFFLDADDFIPDYALELMMRKMMGTNADLCVGGYTLVWEKTGRQTEVCHKKRFTSPAECFSYCLGAGEMFLPVKLYRTQLFRDSVRIPRDVIIQEDTIGVTQYLGSTQKVCHVDESVYFYWKREGSASMSFSSSHVESLLNVMEIVGKSRMAANFRRSYLSYTAKIAWHCMKSAYATNEQQDKARKIYYDLPLYARCGVWIEEKMANLKGIAKKILGSRR